MSLDLEREVYGHSYKKCLCCYEKIEDLSEDADSGVCAKCIATGKWHRTKMKKKECPKCGFLVFKLYKRKSSNKIRCAFCFENKKLMLKEGI